MYRSAWIYLKSVNDGEHVNYNEAILIWCNINFEGGAPQVATGKISICSCLLMTQSFARDILSELATAGNVSFATKTASSDGGQKDNGTDIQSAQSTLPNHPRTSAGPRGVSTASQDASAQPLQSPNYALPMYSTELGRLPVYEQFNFRDPLAKSVSVDANVDYPGFAPSRPTGDVQDVSIPGFASIGLSGSVQGFYTEPLQWDTLHHGPSENGDTTTELIAQSDHDTMSILDDDTITMWSTAPAGFE